MSAGRPRDAANAVQLAGWDGPVGEFWTAHADRFDDGVAAYRDPFLDAAAISESATVLDVGCGAGSTTLDAARRAASGSAMGVDLSSGLLELARRRADDQRVGNATFQQTDAQTHQFADQVFDLAISRHGVMFFADPVAAFANIARALRPRGRLVLLTWQAFERNEWLRSFFTALAVGRDIPAPPADAPSPFSLSDPDRVLAVLGAAGFSGIHLENLVRPMYFGADPDDAFDFVSAQHAGLVRDLEPTARAAALDALRTDLTTHHTAHGVVYESAAWLITAHRD